MERNVKLDALRFLYAVAVLLFHSQRFQPTGYFFRGGALGVAFFFILSGYLMAVSIQRKNALGAPEDLGAETWAFLAGKIRSFLPELLVSLVIGFFWMEFLWQDTGIFALAKRMLSGSSSPWLGKIERRFICNLQCEDIIDRDTCAMIFAGGSAEIPAPVPSGVSVPLYRICEQKKNSSDALRCWCGRI